MNQLRYASILPVYIVSILFIGKVSAGICNVEASKIDFNRDWTFVKNKAEWPTDFTRQDIPMLPVTPSQIILTASNENLISDGRDISYIDIKLCDKKGNRCYTASDELTMKVSGPAYLAGSEKIAVVAGLARAVIRSNGESGEITVSASVKNFEKEEIKLKAIRE